MQLGNLPYYILPIWMGYNFEQPMVVFFHGWSGRNQSSIFVYLLICVLPIFQSYGWNLQILVDKKLTYLFL